MNSAKPLYVFINQCMSGVGGGQRYVLAKAKWLIERGWRVIVCHVQNGEVMLNHEGIQFFDIPELRAAPRILGKKRTEEIIGNVLGHFLDSRTVYVESSAPYLGMWGEEFARVSGGKHLCYVLEETPKAEDINFLRFKRKRHELAFIKNTIAKTAFGDCSSSEQDYDDCLLEAYSPSPIEDLPFEGKIVNADYTIGCISRLEKPAVKLMLDGIVDFCSKNTATSLTVVLVGDTPYESVKKEIAEYDNKLPNLNVQSLGYLSPIPRQLIKEFDVFIGKAGAATACAGEGIPTIRYTLDTDEVAGFDRIVEVDGKAAIQMSQASGANLPSLLEYALIQGGLDEIRELNAIKCAVSPVDYSDHMDFIPNSNAKDYYDCYSSRIGMDRLLVSYWIKMFGNTRYENALIAFRSCFGKRA